MTDDELYEAFEKAFPDRTYPHTPRMHYLPPFGDVFNGFQAGVRVAEERIAALEERLELWAEDGEGNKVKLEIGDSDGIGCRDETIKLLDEKVKRYEAKPKVLDASEVTEISGKLRQAANIMRQNADDLREAHGKDIYRIEKTEPEVAAAFREETALADFLDHLADAHFGPLPKPEV